MRQSSVGNWGWFEDVHGHESAFLPDLGGRKKDEEGNNDGGKGEGRRRNVVEPNMEAVAVVYSQVLMTRTRYHTCLV